MSDPTPDVPASAPDWAQRVFRAAGQNGARLHWLLFALADKLANAGSNPFLQPAGEWRFTYDEERLYARQGERCVTFPIETARGFVFDALHGGWSVESADNPLTALGALSHTERTSLIRVLWRDARPWIERHYGSEPPRITRDAVVFAQGTEGAPQAFALDNARGQLLQIASLIDPARAEAAPRDWARAALGPDSQLTTDRAHWVLHHVFREHAHPTLSGVERRYAIRLGSPLLVDSKVAPAGTGVRIPWTDARTIALARLRGERVTDARDPFAFVGDSPADIEALLTTLFRDRPVGMRPDDEPVCDDDVRVRFRSVPAAHGRPACKADAILIHPRSEVIGSLVAAMARTLPKPASAKRAADGADYKRLMSFQAAWLVRWALGEQRPRENSKVVHSSSDSQRVSWRFGPYTNYTSVSREAALDAMVGCLRGLWTSPLPAGLPRLEHETDARWLLWQIAHDQMGYATPEYTLREERYVTFFVGLDEVEFDREAVARRLLDAAVVKPVAANSCSLPAAPSQADRTNLNPARAEWLLHRAFERTPTSKAHEWILTTSTYSTKVRIQRLKIGTDEPVGEVFEADIADARERAALALRKGTPLWAPTSAVRIANASDAEWLLHLLFRAMPPEASLDAGDAHHSAAGRTITFDSAKHLAYDLDAVRAEIVRRMVEEATAATATTAEASATTAPAKEPNVASTSVEGPRRSLPDASLTRAEATVLAMQAFRQEPRMYGERRVVTQYDTQGLKLRDYGGDSGRVEIEAQRARRAVARLLRGAPLRSRETDVLRRANITTDADARLLLNALYHPLSDAPEELGPYTGLCAFGVETLTLRAQDAIGGATVRRYDPSQMTRYLADRFASLAPSSTEPGEIPMTTVSKTRKIRAKAKKDLRVASEIAIARSAVRAVRRPLVELAHAKLGARRERVVAFLDSPEGLALLKILCGLALAASPFAEYQEEDGADEEGNPSIEISCVNQAAVIADRLREDGLADLAEAGLAALGGPLFAELRGVLAAFSPAAKVRVEAFEAAAALAGGGAADGAEAAREPARAARTRGAAR